MLSEKLQQPFKVPEKLSLAALRSSLTLLVVFFLLSYEPIFTSAVDTQPNTTLTSPDFSRLSEPERNLYAAGLSIYFDFYQANKENQLTFGSGLFTEIYQVVTAVAEGTMHRDHPSVRLLRDGWAPTMDRTALLIRARTVIDNLPNKSFGSTANPDAVRTLLYSQAEQAPGFFLDQFTFIIDPFFDQNPNIHGMSNGSQISMGEIPTANVGSPDLQYRQTFEHEARHGIDGNHWSIEKVAAYKQYVTLEQFIMFITQYTKATHDYLKLWTLLPAKEAIKFDAAKITNWNYRSAPEKENLFLVQQIQNWMNFLGTTKEKIIAEMQTESIVLDTNNVVLMKYMAWKVAKKLVSDPNLKLRADPLIATLLYGSPLNQDNISMDGLVGSVNHTFVHQANSTQLPNQELFLVYYNLVNTARDEFVAAQYQTPDHISVIPEQRHPADLISQFGGKLLGIYQYAPDDASLYFYSLPQNPFARSLDYFFIEFDDRLQLESTYDKSIINPWDCILVFSKNFFDSFKAKELVFKYDAQNLEIFKLEITYNGKLIGTVYSDPRSTELYATGEVLQVISVPYPAVVHPLLNQEVRTDFVTVPQGEGPTLIYQVDKALAHNNNATELSVFGLPTSTTTTDDAVPFILFQNAIHASLNPEALVIYNGMLLINGNLVKSNNGGSLNLKTGVYSYDGFDFSFHKNAFSSYLKFVKKYIDFSYVSLEEKIVPKVHQTPAGAVIEYYIVATWKTRDISHFDQESEEFQISPIGSQKYETIYQPIDVPSGGTALALEN